MCTFCLLVNQTVSQTVGNRAMSAVVKRVPVEPWTRCRAAKVDAQQAFSGYLRSSNTPIALHDSGPQLRYLARAQRMPFGETRKHRSLAPRFVAPACLLGGILICCNQSARLMGQGVCCELYAAVRPALRSRTPKTTCTTRQTSWAPTLGGWRWVGAAEQAWAAEAVEPRTAHRWPLRLVQGAYARMYAVQHPPCCCRPLCGRVARDRQDRKDRQVPPEGPVPAGTGRCRHRKVR